MFLNSVLIIGQHADCDKMLLLKDTIYQAKNISGYGEKLEFTNNNIENKKAFESEKILVGIY